MLDVAHGNVEGAQERGAHRAGSLALRPEHPEIGDESVVPPEQGREGDRPPLLVAKLVIPSDLAARRQRPALRRHMLDVAPELDLLGEQSGAGGAIFGAVVGIGPADSGGHGWGGFELRHWMLLDSATRREPRILRARYKVRHEERVKRAFCLLPLLLLAAPAGAAERGPAGSYRLVGEQDVASGLMLRPDGRFQYFLMAGALDEQAEGRWSVAGGIVALVTEPVPVPPVFSQGASAKTEAAALSVKVSSPEGRGIAGVDLRVGFDEGAPVDDYTQEDGWSLPAEEKRTPRWIELMVRMHRVASPRFPIDLGSGNALAFTLAPNDLGVLDFKGVEVELADGALIVHRDGTRLRYEAVQPRRSNPR